MCRSFSLNQWNSFCPLGKSQTITQSITWLSNRVLCMFVRVTRLKDRIKENITLECLLHISFFPWRTFHTRKMCEWNVGGQRWDLFLSPTSTINDIMTTWSGKNYQGLCDVRSVICVYNGPLVCDVNFSTKLDANVNLTHIWTPLYDISLYNFCLNILYYLKI